MTIKKRFVSCFPLMFALAVQAAVPGRLAFVNDASASKDADDICAIPFQVALLAAFDATDKLVHWSYNCDYTGSVITSTRVGQLQDSLFGAVDIWGDPQYGEINTNLIFNCRNTTQRNAAIAHLAARINESSATNLLWIIEAGEPDVIGYALEEATQSKRQYVKVVTHHTHNDVGAYWSLTGNIADLPGMASDFIVRIPDQNTELKAAVSNFGWMTSSTDPRIMFLEEQYLVSTSGDWNPPPGTVDCSDAGMVWYVLDGGPGAGDTTPSPAKFGTKITGWCTAHPYGVTNTTPVVSFNTPSTNITVMAGTNLYVRVTATDADGITQVRLYKDGVRLVRTEGGSPYEWGLETQNDPELKNLAAGSFVLTAEATDSLGTIGQTAMGITVTVIAQSTNLPPYFINDPFNKPAATNGIAYSQPIGGQAVDPEGGTKTFSKVSGPEWLTVTSSGTVQGTPGSVDVGQNDFVVKVTDNGGLYDTATMTINVVAGTPQQTETFESIATEDGFIKESSETSNVGGDIDVAGTGSASLRVGDMGTKVQIKTIVSFDTSSIPDGAVVQSATLKLKRGAIYGAVTNLGLMKVDIKGGVGFNSTNALESADFQAPANAAGVAVMSMPSTNGTWSTGSLNATGLTYVSKTGRTQFKIYFEIDDDNDGTSDYLGFYPGDNVTAANRPVLEVTYQ